MASPTNPSPIPPFYRHFFAHFEPVLGLTGFYYNHITPQVLLTTMNPLYSSPVIAPETRTLLDLSSGLYAQNLFLQLVLPRVRPHDLAIWKVWQGSLLVVDSVLTVAVLVNMRRVGLLWDVRSWRGMDWTNVGSMAVLLSIRAAFVLGWGFGNRKTAGKEEKKV